MRSHARNWTAIVGITALLWAGIAVQPVQAQDSPLSNFYAQAPVWNQCQSDSCTRIQVPLDYAKPQGEVISIAVRVIGSRELPSLLTNPGGPGSAGIEFARYLASSLPPEVRAQYSIVGFDPRGTGDSSPISCITGKFANSWLRTDSTPDNSREVSILMSRAHKISRGCQAFSPDLARHIGTDETVRDMDIIRSVLGNETLNWLGYSYGTSLGTRFAELFPEKVGRMVLDGAVDPSLNAMQLSRDQAVGFQTALKRFNKKYPGSIATINSLLAQLDYSTLPTGTRYRLVQSEALNAIFFSMYSPSLWGSLNQALNQAQSGNGRKLQQISYSANDQLTPTKFGSNMLSAFYAINCWDLPATPAAPQLKTFSETWARGSTVPEISRAMSWGNAPCSKWFGHSSERPAPAQSQTTAPLVIIGTTYDPATPLKWAKNLHEQLPTSTLLTFVGDGHTAYLNGNPCVDAYVNNYLVTGKPGRSLTCR